MKCVRDRDLFAFRHFLQKEAPQFDALHLAEILGEEHRAGDLAVCANFKSHIVAQPSKKMLDEQSFRRSQIRLRGVQPRWNATLESPACDAKK